jgi:hypothetical protein
VTTIQRLIVKSGGVGVCCIAAAVMFLCSKDYNPFTDLSNANARVTSWSFTGRKSVPIYETGTFKIFVALREEVDSFSLSSPKNRFWKDTVVKSASASEALKAGPYFFDVSFYDTGEQKTTLTTFRSNGDNPTQDFIVHVYNPLHQEDINGSFGDTIILFSKDTVPDQRKGVLYHWKLEGTWSDVSLSNRLAATFVPFSSMRGSGWLWVSDISGKCESPRVSFSYSLNDTSKPIIECINDGMRGDTIFSGDTMFAFQVRITDAGNVDPESCTVNGARFDLWDHSLHVHSKMFGNLPRLTSGGPIEIAVYAMDNRQFWNEVRDTFYAIFSPGGAQSARTTVSFSEPSTSVARTASRRYTILGTAQSDHGDTMTMSVDVNGKTDPATMRIVAQGEWSWSVFLDTAFSTVTVRARGTSGAVLASDRRVIYFDTTAADSIKPMIWEVSTGGVPIIGPRYITDLNELRLKIIAFDNGSGIAQLRVNETILPVDTSRYSWTWSTGPLKHDHTTGNPVSIFVTDGKNNVQQRTITIFKNSIPYLAGDLAIPAQCCAESTYTADLIMRDDDNDIVVPTVLSPPGMKVVRDGHFLHIKWEPTQENDGASDTLVIELMDPYNNPNRYSWIFTRKRCSLSAAKLAFRTGEDAFPKVLQADWDSLDVRLAVDSSGISFAPVYNAKFLDDGKSLLENDPVGALVWKPLLADTGFRKLMVTVGDSSRSFDTLFPAIWVLPKNRYRCRLSAEFSGETTSTGALDLFTRPQPESLSFTIHDEDPLLTESYTVVVSLGSLRSVSVINNREFFVAIDPNSRRNADTLTVRVHDATGSDDSLRFTVLYAPSNANTPPSLSGSPGFPVYVCADTSYRWQITSYDPNGDPVQIIAKHVPLGLNFEEGNVVKWTPSMANASKDSLVIRLYDQHDSSAVYRWPFDILDCGNMPPEVQFLTTGNDFPKVIQADTAAVSLQLKTQPGTGVSPFSFKALVDNGQKTICDTAGTLFWKPTAADTGLRTLTITVKDYYGTRDTILPKVSVQVLPKNQHACRLSYTFSGDTLPSGDLYMFSTTQPESALFVISDKDNPQTEGYTVKITKRFSGTSTINLPGSGKSFSVLIRENGSWTTNAADTIVVSVKDSTHSVDTVRLVIRYPVGAPSDISQLRLELDAADAYTYRWGNSVSQWPDASNQYFSISQQDPDRQPRYSQNAQNGMPAVYFDHISDYDDGLYSTSFGRWADTPFTLFVVFSPNSLPAGQRQTLVSVNTMHGFGVGITCEGKLGIFNDESGNSCPVGNYAATDLTVAAKTWYVASFQSTMGIAMGGKIHIQAWLNGTAASQAMDLTTLSGSGLMVGTGSTEYTGSYDGSIASILIYKRAISDDDRSLVERYLGGRYGIAIK